MDEFTPCSACSRTPLVGEEVTVMRDGRREAAVCDLCLDRPRTATLGDAARRERIRSVAGAANVRRAWPAPARSPVKAIAG
ncbi:MAG: hypothetical protein ACRDKV_01070 [Solirubrobacterales bacterium]